MTVPASYPDSSSSFTDCVVVTGRGDADCFASSLLRDEAESEESFVRGARGNGTPMTTVYTAMNAEINQPAPSGARGDAN